MKLYHCCPSYLYEKQVTEEGFVPQYKCIFLANTPKVSVRGHQRKGVSMMSVVEFNVDESEVEKHQTDLSENFCDTYYVLRTKVVPHNKFELLHTLVMNGGE